VARWGAEVGGVQRTKQGVLLKSGVEALDEGGEEWLAADALVERIALGFETDRGGQPGRPATGGSLARSSISGL
jgi:hypothetical protein